MADVKDLLIRMSLDTATFKRNIQDAKSTLRTLKSEYKAVASSDEIGKAGENLLQNLKDQKTTAEALVAEYNKGIAALRTQLQNVTPGSQAAFQMEQQIQKLENGLARAKTQVNELQAQIDGVKLDNFISKAETVASTFNSLRMGFGELLDGFGDTADSADAAFVSREAAFTSATKNVEDVHQTQEDLDALNASLREMTTVIPQTYQELAALMGVGATLGVPYENLEKFTEVMAKLNVATNVQGESGAQLLAQLLNITEKDYANVDRAGAALTELGNNSATTEQAILEMAQRAATGLSAVGMGLDDILAISAAINSVGINAEAGGSSVSKLAVKMDEASKVGAQAREQILDAYDGAFDSIYEMYAFIDAQPSLEGGWKTFADVMGMTMADSKKLMNTALAAERFSQAMGMTVDEFSAGWNEDAANQMLSFFRTLGEMDGTEAGENMLWTMDQLGITEIRQSNMVRALAGNWELYAKMLDLGREAYAENVALENESQRAFSTTESQRVLNANKEQNALEAMGQTVTAIRQPWDDFFADVKQGFADMPGWVQTAAGLVSEGLGSLDGALETAGKLSFSVVSIANAVKDLSGSAIGAKILKGASTVGKVGLGVGGTALAGYGLYELGKYIADISDSTDDISEKLSGLKIVVDPDSTEAALQAISEVQSAADRLSGTEMEQYAGTSRVVQMGYGTAEMYGTALAYEQEKGRRAIEAVYENFGRQINEAEADLIAAPDEAGRQAAQARIEALTDEMVIEAGKQREELAANISAVINGAIKQVGSEEMLSGISEKYNLLDMIFLAYGQVSEAGRDTLSEEAKGTLRNAMQAAGYDVSRMRLTEIWDAVTFREMAEYIYGQLAGEVENVSNDGQLMSILSAALSSGALSMADSSQFSGSLLALLQAMDIKSIADTGVNQWKDIGKNSMAGLGQGIDENADSPKISAEAAANGLIDAAKSVLGIQSPSTEFYGIGLHIDEGLANGIYAGASEAIAAASWLAAQIEETLRVDLDIHSPSGLAETLGGYFAEGFARGLERGVSRVESSLDRLTGALTPKLDGSGNPASRNVNVTLALDGKTLAQSLAPLMDTALGDLNWDM